MSQNNLFETGLHRGFYRKLAGSVVGGIGVGLIVFAQEEMRAEIPKGIVTGIGTLCIILGMVVAGNVCRIRGSEQTLVLPPGQTNYASLGLENASEEIIARVAPTEFKTETKDSGLSNYTPSIPGYND